MSSSKRCASSTRSSACTPTSRKSTGRPTDDGAPALPAPSWDRVDLDLPPTDGDLELTAEPDPIEVSPLVTGGPGGLVGNASGCQLNCITSALLRSSTTNPSMAFELGTTVPVAAYVWVSTTAPAMQDGLPVMATWPDHYNQDETRNWAATLSSLQFDTHYYFTLLVVDEDGHERWATTQFTTVDGVDQLVGNGDDCYYQCIERAYLIGTPGHDTADIYVETSAIADIDVVVSTSEPGWIGSSPILPPDRPFAVTQQNSWKIRGTASELEPETTYHVLITATDSDGFSAHAIGSFTTDAAPPPPTEVIITFAGFDVWGDGDHGSLDRGEIEFRWGIEGWDYVGEREEEKISSNTGVYLGPGVGRGVAVPPGGALPRIAGNAIERDWQDHEVWDQYNCNRGGLGAPEFVTTTDEDCNTTTNVALLDPQPLSWLDTLPTCSEFGYTDSRADQRCAVVDSPNMGSDFVSFSMIVAFHVVTP